MITDIACKETDYLDLAIVQEVICSVLALIVAPLIEPTMWIMPFNEIQYCWFDIAVVSVLEGFAVVFAILGQIYISPSLTALISSTASVYTAILGYIFLKESMRVPEVIGCVLIGFATLLASYRLHSSVSSYSVSNGYSSTALFEYNSVELPDLIR